MQAQGAADLELSYFVAQLTIRGSNSRRWVLDVRFKKTNFIEKKAEELAHVLIWP